MTQNLNLITSWLLLTGQQCILALTPAAVLERKEASKVKGQSGEGAKPKEGQSSSRPGSARRYVLIHYILDINNITLNKQ